ncbi:hypothetical protein M1B35_19420, partial [Pseudomonas sp. MAFF 302046]|nr:hypothetical protein [Pseudomonas morbosilactucae]
MPQKLVTMINDIISHVRLEVEDRLGRGVWLQREKERGPETQKPAFAGFCEASRMILKFELVPRRR